MCVFFPTFTNGAAKRKMQACQKKIKQFGRPDIPSPSSEDSSLEDLLHTEPVKEEHKEEFLCSECGGGWGLKKKN